MATDPVRLVVASAPSGLVMQPFPYVNISCAKFSNFCEKREISTILNTSKIWRIIFGYTYTPYILQINLEDLFHSWTLLGFELFPTVFFVNFFYLFFFFIDWPIIWRTSGLFNKFEPIWPSRSSGDREHTYIIHINIQRRQIYLDLWKEMKVIDQIN